MRRYLETFIARPWLFLLPLALVLAGSAVLAARAVRNATPYTAQATVAVNLDPTRERRIGEPPLSQQYAELLGELMSTDTFILGALGKTTPDPALAEAPDDATRARWIRALWKQQTLGPNLMRVTLRCREPTFCVDMLAAVLGDFRAQVASAQVDRRTYAVAFYDQQVRMAEDRLRSMAPTEPGREAAIQIYETLLARRLDAGLEEALASRVGEQQFRILEPPSIVGPPASPQQAAVPPLLVGLVVGLGLSAAFVAIATWLDRSVRTVRDVDERRGPNAAAEVPDGRRPDAPTADFGPRLEVAANARRD